MNKETDMTMKLNPYFKDTLETSNVVWSHDENSYQFNFDFTNFLCDKPFELTDGKLRILLEFLDDENADIQIYPLEIESEKLGQAHFIIPDKILGYVGDVKASLTIDFDDKSHDLGSFYFRMKKSPIDEKMPELQFWVDEFDQAFELFKHGLDEFNEDIAESNVKVNEIKDLIVQNDVLKKAEAGPFGDFRDWDDTLIAKMKNEFAERQITPKMFGAKGDGVTVDTQAFKDCLNIENASILVTAGTYIIDEGLHTKFNRTKITFDDNAKIIVKTDDTFITSAKNDCVFSNINAESIFQKAKSAYDSCALKLMAAKGNVVENCTFTNFPGHSIFLSHASGRGCEANVIKNNQIEVNKEIVRFDDCAGIMCGYSGDGYFHEYNVFDNNTVNGGEQNLKLGIAMIGHGKFNKFVNNNVRNCEEYGIVAYESAYVDNTLYGNVIDKNIVSNIGAKAGKTTHKGMGIYAMKSHRTIISNNFVEKCLINSDSSETLTRGLIGVSGCTDISVSNNKTFDSGKHGIVAASCDVIDIVNNTIDKTTEMGIRLMDNSNLKLEGNTSTNNGQFSLWGSFSARISGLETSIGKSGNNIRVVGNTFENKKNQTVYLETKTDDGLLNNLVIEGNSIKGDNSFMYIKKVKNAKIINNTCKSDSNQGSIIVADTSSDNATFENNVLDASERVAIGINYQGTNGIFNNNLILNHDIQIFYKASKFAKERTTLYFSSAPTTGDWSIGDRVVNTSPVSGNFTEWVYTSDGWKGINKIE